MSLNSICRILLEKTNFLIMTHKDPDADGIGSMLALGKVLSNADKDVVLLTEKPVHAPVNLLSGCDGIVHEIDPEKKFDVVIALDCGDRDRIGAPKKCFEGVTPLINIDHHQSRDLFGDYNLVDSNSSSTGELISRVIKEAGFPLDSDIAENLFAAIKADTGSFNHDNTSAEALRTAAEMVENGADPRQISLKLSAKFSRSKMKLLELALGVVEFYNEGMIGIVILTAEIFDQAQARQEDSDQFVDHLRSISGVELAVIVRETDQDTYKFSMRSNGRLNVANLASMFGGGGHAKAAGFEYRESIGTLRKKFLKEAGKLLSATSN